MQRKEIDHDACEAIREELVGRVETPGTVTVIEGQLEDHGNVRLTRQDGRFFADADETALIMPKGERKPQS